MRQQEGEWSAVALDPQVQGLLEAMAAQGVKSFEECSVPEAREVLRNFTALEGAAEPVAEVYDLTVPGPAGELPLRVYRPEGSTPLPVIVYFHGGGWVTGDVEIVDKPCRTLANATGAVIASVEYRLAPETKFPGAVEDCFAATTWVAEHAEKFGGDPARVGVAGDSAGGNLAAVVAQLARGINRPRLALQLLIYPATDATTEWDSTTENAEGYLLTKAAIEWFGGHYLNRPEDAEDPRFSPLRAASLAGLPPAIVVTGGYDPLRDEGRAYAAALREAGVTVTESHNEGMVHGFAWLAGVVDHVSEVYRQIGEATREVFGRPG
jgi:acetyl esterase